MITTLRACEAGVGGFTPSRSSTLLISGYWQPWGSRTRLGNSTGSRDIVSEVKSLEVARLDIIIVMKLCLTNKFPLSLLGDPRCSILLLNPWCSILLFDPTEVAAAM
jgi:hypothetical protein